MKISAFAILYMLSVFGVVDVHAGCQCVCMNGNVEAVCSSTLDIKPICPPRVCPIVTPSIKPLPSLKIPPLGTSHCSHEQVYNKSTHRYEWNEVCY